MGNIFTILFGSQSIGELKLSLEVLQYENSVLKRELQEQSCLLKRLQSAPSCCKDSKPSFSVERTESNLHEALRKKYMEAEEYKHKLETMHQRFLTCSRQQQKGLHLVPVFDTCSSSKISYNDDMPQWSPVLSVDYLKHNEA